LAFFSYCHTDCEQHADTTTEELLKKICMRWQFPAAATKSGKRFGNVLARRLVPAALWDMYWHHMPA